ncbi:unnamed protein product [Paramecium sonneborni]|uniref:C2H2-type domain-containing protein n=1 Tax=Paramecium sonneborni TaxID=65129 RepID=A0A8S1MZU3_9CILI|nr:unnamed protein product [Paramecium sonneborni]
MEVFTLPIFQKLNKLQNCQEEEIIEPLDEPEHQPTCEECKKVFTNNSKLQRHIREIHQNLKQFRCEQCGKEFKRSQHLKRHQLTHSGSRPFECESTKQI